MHITVMPKTTLVKSSASDAKRIYAPRPVAVKLLPPQLTTSATIVAFQQPPAAAIAPVT